VWQAAQLAPAPRRRVDRTSGRLRGGWLGRWSESAEVEVEVAMPMGRLAPTAIAFRTSILRAARAVARHKKFRQTANRHSAGKARTGQYEHEVHLPQLGFSLA